MSEYDKELQTGTDEYEAAVKPLERATHSEEELRKRQRPEERNEAQQDEGGD
jgi:hypothetical protein